MQAAARQRRVASNHSASGQTNGFRLIASAVMQPATTGRSRYLQASITRQVSGNDTLPPSHPSAIGAQSSGSPYTRQSRTFAIHRVAGTSRKHRDTYR